MIDKEISNLTAIDTLIRQEQPFAVYRIPGEAAPHLLMQATGNVRLLHDLEELDGERGFVIAPFRVSEESPIVLIQPEEPEHFLLPDEYSEEEQEAFRLFQEQETFSETYTEGYETCFRTFIEALRSSTFTQIRHWTVSGFLPFGSVPCCMQTLYSFLRIFVLHPPDRCMDGQHSRNYLIRRKERVEYGGIGRYPAFAEW